MTRAAVSSGQAPLAAALAGRAAFWRVGLVLAASWLLAASSWVAVPLWPVPMTLQTYAVLAFAALAGPRLTFETIAVWFGQALIGLPLLADGAAGPSPFAGPTAGYLAGFLIAGVAVGAAAQRPWARSWVGLIVLFLAAHAAILLLGWAWLALRIGPAGAWTGGVLPFLPGAAAKSLLAALTVKLLTPVLTRTAPKTRAARRGAPAGSKGPQ